jgi:hypothetical protein
VVAPATVVLGGVAIADFSMDQYTTNGQVPFANTYPTGWNTNAGRMTVDFQVTPNSFFAANPNAHFVVIARCTTSLIATAARGQGIAIGNATAFPLGGAIDLNPTTTLETWFGGIGAGAGLWPNAETARSIGMQDGKTYRIIVDTTKTNEGNRYLRYRMWTKDAVNGNWISNVDTGDVLDHNVGADLTQSGLLFGYAFQSNLSAWSLAFTNTKVTWGPAESATPDITTKLSRYGAQMEGDIRFLGYGRRIKAPFSGGPALTDFLTFQSDTTNTGTSLVVKPNGTSTVANLLFSNNSTSTSLYQAVTFGMSGAVALMEALALGTTTPVFGVNVGAGNRVATFKTTGLNILGGSKDIGQSIGWGSGITNFGGTNAQTFVGSGGVDMDAVSAVGAWAAFFTGTYSAANIEGAVRPLYCMLSSLIADLKNKKVI